MLSRHAESFFWLSRNVERAETVARIFDVTATRSVEADGADGWGRRAWSIAFAIATFSDPRAAVGGVRATLERCIFDPANASSIVSAVSIARSNAIGVRAELSTETWENINQLYLDVNGRTLEGVGLEGLSGFLRRVRDRCQAIAGVSDGTLLHVDGWNFLQLGRYVERGYLAARMLNAMESLDEPWPEWQRLLEMSCASMPFARAAEHLRSARDAVAFIVLDATFPRSIKFCANEIDAALHRISETAPGQSFANEAEKLAGRLAATLNFCDIDDVFEQGLHVFLEGVMDDLLGIVTAIQRAYFPRVPVAAVPLQRSEAYG
ncbi:MAG TPA: alpha-E domain-containing protein [Candidatus Baltobacteraceae bacterium]|nr:alpha-E domain-containing protein [Candidatus Baltobacteraceae bacterium]